MLRGRLVVSNGEGEGQRGTKRTSTVIVEKGVQAGTVDEKALGVEDSQAPCVVCAREGGVVEAGYGREGLVGAGVGLVVAVVLVNMTDGGGRPEWDTDGVSVWICAMKMFCVLANWYW